MPSPFETFSAWCNCQKPPAKHFWPIPPPLAGLFYNHRVVAEKHVEFARSHLLKDIKIYFDYIDDGDLNARASICESPTDPTDKLGIIALFRGSVLLPLDLFQRMFAHPEVLPELGNSSLETKDGQFNEGLSDNIDTLQNARATAGRPKEPVVPRCPVRREFVTAISGFAFDFLVLHELAHIVCGHLDYILPFTGSTSILESVLSATDEYGLPTINRQAIELGADGTAVGLTIDHILKLGSTEFSNPGWQEFFSSLEQRVFTWAFAVSALFRLWGIKINPGNMEDAAYPPMAMRFASAFTTASTYIKTVKPEFAETFDKITNDAMRACGIAIEKIGGTPVKSEDLDPVYSSLGKQHYATIRDCWLNTVLPELKKVAYAPLGVR